MLTSYQVRAKMFQHGYKVLITNFNVIKRHHQVSTKTKTILQPRPDVVPVFRRANNFTDKVALRDTFGHYTYGNLFMGAKELSNEISVNIGTGKNSQNVLFLCGNDANYVVSQWAIWMSGQIAIPLSPLHPQNLLEYYASDSGAKLIVTTLEYADLMQRVAKNTNTKLHVLDDKLAKNIMQMNPTRKGDMEAGLSSDFYNKSNAMILYTSGTTGKPKGVVLSHKNLNSQITGLIDSWRWTEKDSILHTLPLHHIHGIVNALLCPHYIGAKCIMLPKFDANTCWAYLLGINTNSDDRRISVFMAVPTIYSKLINEYQKVFSGDPKMVEYIHGYLKNRVRLMVSGSAPLPATVHKKWFEISGHKLLERYGMTEIGMCLSNLYDSDREPGYVGVPLPGVSVRLASKIDDDEDNYITHLEVKNVNGNISTNLLDWTQHGDPIGELQVKGDTVFREYHNKIIATQQEFTIEGWFKTGDIAQYSLKEKKFKMLGRQSVDIIKSGGFKISALEVETYLLEHPQIAECVVLGVKDEDFGERLLAVIVLKPNMKKLNLDEFKTWAEERMPKYCIPRQVMYLPELPRNSMGKINKKDLKETLAL
ncbi:malonate--CoA ligase ACSF3, mitochondrial [Onthophagus taurus]|uniref:malonate--CoA ligase ACSF3, mitochondrial n=1 Tax=Onthophagus taurus TaxID=166361 RepID=UPI0039BE1636